MSAAMLALDEVTVAFDGFVVLNALSLELRRGELRFLIGPNGAGKTTMLDVMTGKTRPDSGRVWFDGDVDVLAHPEHALVRLGIGRKFQTPAVYPSLSLTENLEVQISFWNGKAIAVEVPNFIEVQITKCDPGVRGDTVSGSQKPATVSTGYTCDVPLFVEEGEWIRIDTRTGLYMDRVKK